MDTGFDQAELSRLVANLIRIGTVSDVDYANARIRVQIAEIRTDWVPWIEARAGTDVSWWAPEPGEQVMVLSPGGDTAQAVALPALFRAAAPPPADTADKRRVTFADGASVEYDRAAHVLTIDLATPQGTVLVKSKTAIVEAEKVDLGAAGGPRVARIGDKVRITAGSSAGLNGIIEEGSEIVHAA